MTLFRAGGTYRRISKDEDADEDGVTRQAEDTDAHADRNRIPVADRHRYTDNDLSATQGKHRPGYAALLAAIERREVDVVIVYMLGRLWRNRRERAEGIEHLRQHGVSVLCVKGPQLDLTTASGRMLAGVLGEVDTFEVEQMSERQQRETLQRVERAEPPTGPRCFGYTVDGRELVPDEAKAVAGIFTAFLAGASLSGLAADLNARGVANRNGKAWSHNAVRGMLLNARYAGLRTYRGTLYPGGSPQLVEREVWEAAAQILAGADRRTSPGPARKWLGSGLYGCGVCADGTTVTSAQRDGERVYRCRRVKHLVRKAAPIDAVVGGGLVAGELVRGYVVERLSQENAVDLLVDDDRPDLVELTAKAVALRARLKGLAEEFADDDDADPAEFRAAARRIRNRLAAVEQQMAHPQRALILGDLITAEDTSAAWAALPLDRRRAVVDMLMTVTILPGKPGRPRGSRLADGYFDLRTVRIEAKG